MTILVENYLDFLNKDLRAAAHEWQGPNIPYGDDSNRPNLIRKCSMLENSKMKINCLRRLRDQAAMNPFYQHRIDRYIDEITDQALLHILAPLAVKPDYQKQGIGGLLIREGLRRLIEMGSEMVFVLCHMEYYPKFGFIPDAKKIGFSAPYPIPEEYANAWMVQSLNPNGFTKNHGKIVCSTELNKPEHWRE